MGNCRVLFHLLFVFLNATSFVLCQTCLEGERAKQFNDKLVKDHNKYRSQHGTPPLEPDLNLMEDAIKWSKQLANTNVLQHGSTGENLYKNTNTGPIDESQLDAVKPWYDEIKLYTKPEFSLQTGHFTQVVWRDTRKLGCGVCSGSGGTVVTCRYSPPGNFRGQFEENVPPLKSESDQNNNEGPTDHDYTSENTISSKDYDGYNTGEIELEETTSTIGHEEHYVSDTSDYEETTPFRKRITPSTTPQPKKHSNTIEII
ncbi:Golgi-associated plant pathogenesis-related protein 1-like [Planococcus citri]|uniref:Golgi-associated plant pathogenesis-related protein 1-like n=1 Tax=Planococcus citri TaxID=170843 RepID=UPI0031F91A62